MGRFSSRAGDGHLSMPDSTGVSWRHASGSRQSTMNRYHDLDKRIDLLEERMNTSYERMNASFERLNAAFERLRADMIKRDTDARERENRLILFMVMTIGLFTAVLGAIIALTN